MFVMNGECGRRFTHDDRRYTTHASNLLPDVRGVFEPTLAAETQGDPIPSFDLHRRWRFAQGHATRKVCGTLLGPCRGIGHLGGSPVTGHRIRAPTRPVVETPQSEALPLSWWRLPHRR